MAAAKKKPGIITLAEARDADPAGVARIERETAPVRNTGSDYARDVFRRLGDLSQVKVFGNRILVAKFLRETVGASGRILAAKQTQLEDQYQGKIGLVVKKGTIAFQDDESHHWHGDDVKIGDWVLYGYNDGTDLDICPPGTNDHVKCKILKEGDVQGIVPVPDFIY